MEKLRAPLIYRCRQWEYCAEVTSCNASVCYGLYKNKVKSEGDKICEQRYWILIGEDSEKIKHLQEEVHNRTVEELETLQKYLKMQLFLH